MSDHPYQRFLDALRDTPDQLRMDFHRRRKPSRVTIDIHRQTGRSDPFDGLTFIHADGKVLVIDSMTGEERDMPKVDTSKYFRWMNTSTDNPPSAE